MLPVFALKMLIGAAFVILALAFAISLAVKRRKNLKFERIFEFDPNGISREDDDYWRYEDHVLNSLWVQRDLAFEAADPLRQKNSPPASVYMEYRGTVKPCIEKFLKMFELADFFGFRPLKKQKEDVLNLQREFEKLAFNSRPGEFEEREYFLEKMIG